MRNRISSRTGLMLFVVISLCLTIFSWQGFAEAKKFKVAIGTVSPRDDLAWGAGHYEMYKWCQKTHPEIDVTFSDSVPFAELESTLSDWASRGTDFIQVGGAWLDAVKSVAPRYPKTMFGLTNGNLKTPNVQTVDWQNEQGGYLAGVLAALMNKTNVIGWIGAQEYPSVVRVGEAYKLGAKSVNPKIKILLTYIGTWHDQTVAHESAVAMADGGADVFSQDCDFAGFGIIKLVKERKLWDIGQDFGQTALAPTRSLGSIGYEYISMFERNLNDAMKGNFGNKIISFGAKDGWNMIKINWDTVPPDVILKVLQVEEEIASGKITVPRITKPTK
jgi:basic membrane protein A